MNLTRQMTYTQPLTHILGPYTNDPTPTAAPTTVAASVTDCPLPILSQQCQKMKEKVHNSVKKFLLVINPIRPTNG